MLAHAVTQHTTNFMQNFLKSSTVNESLHGSDKEGYLLDFRVAQQPGAEVFLLHYRC